MNSETNRTDRPNVYEAITNQIVTAIEGGTGPWVMPWHARGTPLSMPQNPSTKAWYKGVNILSLWATARARGYGSGYWASYRQWLQLGAQVRQGERGATILFYKELAGSTEKEDTPQKVVARSSKVFNVQQVDGWEPPAPPTTSKVEMSVQVDAFVRRTNAHIRHGSYLACYNRRTDEIEMPLLAQFVGTTTSSPTEAYYAVLLHELTHWTGAPLRLDRQFGSRFGDQAYAFEELVAELGAAFLCSALGVANEPREDHAAYLSSWLEIFGRDKKAIFSAASSAQRAIAFLSEVTGNGLN